VGGGYRDTNIDGVSLNWMLRQIERIVPSILPKNASVYSDYLDKTHDPPIGLWRVFFKPIIQDIVGYTVGYTNSKDYNNYSNKKN
jgi:hypothetical protein